jgi:predicted secreted protein
MIIVWWPEYVSVLPYSLRTKSVQKSTSTRTSKRTVRTLLSVQRVHRVNFIKKTSIKIVSIFFSRKNVLKLIIINKITFLHVNINKIIIKKVLK